MDTVGVERENIFKLIKLRVVKILDENMTYSFRLQVAPQPSFAK